VDTTVHLICFDAIGDGLASPQPPEISEVAWLEPDDWHTFAPAVQEALARSPLTSLDNY
jgi:hypothetical protein